MKQDAGAPEAAGPAQPRQRLAWSPDPALQSAVLAQVRDIGRELLRNVPDGVPFALLLSGAFGRGEGAAELRDGSVFIQNDYDFELVLDVSRPTFLRLYRRLRPALDATAEHLAGQLRIKQIDVGLKCLSLLKRSRKTIALYELRHGHYFIAGDRAIPEKLPDYEPSDIPLSEGARLLLNRGAGLLIAALYLLRTSPELSDPERENLETEITKALLACGDLRLLETGLYHYSYSVRAQRVLEQGLLREFSPGESLYRRAIRYKLDWIRSIDLSNAHALWSDVRDLLLQAWAAFERRRLGADFSDWAEYAGLAKPRHEPLLLDLARCLTHPARLLAARGHIRPWLLDGHEAVLLSVLPLKLLSAPVSTLRAGEIDPAPDPQVWAAETSRFLAIWHPGGEAGRVARAIAAEVQT